MPALCGFDLVFTAPFDADSLAGCCRALENVEYPLCNLNLWVYGALPQDGEKLTLTGVGSVHTGQVQPGWAAYCNQTAYMGKAPWVVFLQPGAQVRPGFFTALCAAAEQTEVAALECRQLPCEASHHIDPATLNASWVGGAAFAVRRQAFEQVGGFDVRLPQGVAEVDLSWRLRAAGHVLRCVPGAVVYVSAEGEDTLAAYAEALYGRLLLSYKYGRACRGNGEYIAALHSPRHYGGVRRTLLKMYLHHFYPSVFWPLLLWRWRHPLAAYQNITDFSEGYAPQRGTQALPFFTETPLVSVIVRTMGRPQVLRGALQSLRNQTYRAFEVIVAEDGPPTAQEMIQQEFSDLPVCYHAMGRVAGRGANGNAGLALAQGEYINFLDDDDFLYPDHLEWMVAAALERPNQPVILGTAMAMETDVVSSDPYKVQVKSIHPMRFDRFDLLKMSKMCLIPIQSALFKRSLYEQYGGLKEGVEGNEDWAMWLKFLGHAARPWVGGFDVTRATSIFTVPADAQAEALRVEKYRAYYKDMLEDESLAFTVTVKDLHDMYNAMLRDVQHLQALGQLDSFVQEQLKF